MKYEREILWLEYRNVPSERIQTHSDMVGNFQVVNVATQSVVTQLSLCATQSSKIAFFCSDIKIGYHFSTINHVTNLCNSMMLPFASSSYVIFRILLQLQLFIFVRHEIVTVNLSRDHVKNFQWTFALLHF